LHTTAYPIETLAITFWVQIIAYNYLSYDKYTTVFSIIHLYHQQIVFSCSLLLITVLSHFFHIQLHYNPFTNILGYNIN
jgi:hypothetical protein